MKKGQKVKSARSESSQPEKRKRNAKEIQAKVTKETKLKQ